MTGERKGTLWAIEIVITGLITLGLLPMSCLYLMDLSGGTISPDAEWALGAAIGVTGVWLALLRPDSFFQAHRPMRWLVVATLVVAMVILAYMAWGSVRFGGFGVGIIMMIAPIGVAMHQLVRLLRLGLPARSR